MNPDFAIDIFKSTVLFALYVITPFLAVTLVVGLATSLIQAITSLQEQTLSFAPKLLALAGAGLLLAPWLLRSLVEFTTSLFTRMGSLGP
ncbi:MAG: flagellar biosynthetic protein FliQ [Opitutaceae bacterium]|nr:flagellar biosynthetic protein FliQ [Opitutaceae bacterium]